MTKLKFRHFMTATALITATALSGCYFDKMSMRHQVVDRLAGPVQMMKREISAEPFQLTVIERVRNQGGNARIYIEGDGVAWVSKNQPSLDPTPRSPVALHLATRDNSPNVIYMARPCQYSKMTRPGPCPSEYWRGKRFAPEVINSMSVALDDIKRRHGIREFELIGFSGGAAVAALLAAGRDDVISIRSVAGNLNHAQVNANHKVSQMSGSLNPVDIAASIAHIPQHHFIGEWDKIITPDVYDSFRAAAGPNSCMRSSMVREADHESGWVSVWPAALARPVDCNREDLVCYMTPAQCMIP